MNGGALVLEHLFQLDMQALAERGMMALPGREQRLRFLGGMRFDPPFLGAGHGKAGVEGFQLLRRTMLRGRCRSRGSASASLACGLSL